MSNKYYESNRAPTEVSGMALSGGQFLRNNGFFGGSFMDVQPDDPLQISVWVKLDTIFIGTPVICSRWWGNNNSSGDGGWWLYTYNVGLATRPSIIVQASGTNRYRVNGTNDINLSAGSWTHLFISKPANADASQVKIYTNGVEGQSVQFDSLNDTDIIYYSLFGINSFFSIGAKSLVSQSNTWQNFFAGRIYGLRFYNSVLTEEQILQIYNGGQPVAPQYNDFNSLGVHFIMDSYAGFFGSSTILLNKSQYGSRVDHNGVAGFVINGTSGTDESVSAIGDIPGNKVSASGGAF